MRFVDSKGRTVERATINGYHFGDRLLEDVKFECEIQNNKIVVIGVLPHHRKYFEQLNTKMWMDVAQKYVDDSELEPIYDYNLELDE